MEPDIITEVNLGGSIKNEEQLFGSIVTVASISGSVSVPETVEVLVKDHDELFNRDIPNQHTIDSITGLREVLDSKADAEDIPSSPATTTSLGTVKVGENLTITEDGVLSVDVASQAEADNTKPITSAAVNTLVGNVNAILHTI